MGAATKKAGRVNGVTGVLMGMVDEKHLRKVAADLKLKDIEQDTPLEQVVVAVHAHFQANTAKDDLGACDVCQGVSDIALDACAYCGTIDDGDSGSADKPAAAPAAPVAAVPGPKAAKGEKAEKAAPAAAEAPKAGPKGKKGDKPALVVVDDTKASSAITTARELDDKVKRVHDLKGQAAVSYWHVGVAIKDIYDSNAWKQRNGEDGKPRYKGFEPFVLHELGMTPTHAYKLMDIANEYTEAQVKAFGTTKLGLLLEAPREDRERIMQEQVEKGASRREIEKEVRRVRKEKGHTKTRRDADKPKKDGSERKAGGGNVGKGRERQTITVANMVGRKTIKLFAKPAGYKNGDDLKGVARATKIKQTPIGVNDLENDVKQFFTLSESPAGEWQLIIETKRSGA